MDILIVGAGIAGLSMALKMQTEGFNVTLIEKESETQNQGGAICLPANAMTGFDKLGLKEAILAHAHQVNEIRYETAQRKLLAKASLRKAPFDVQPFVALKRAEIIAVLKSKLSINILYNCTIKDIVATPSKANVVLSNNSIRMFDLVIAADGIESDTRSKVFSKSSVTELGVTHWRFIVKQSDHAMQPSYLLGEDDAFMFYPISKDELYCYAQKSDPDYQYYQLSENQALHQLFSEYHSSVKAQFDKPEVISKGRLKSVSLHNIYEQNVVLIGDALHGCPPSLQQGAAMALEDVHFLGDLLISSHNVNTSLASYAAQRFERINWVINQSNKIIKLAELGNKPIGRFIRNSIVRLSGPQNVKGWRYLLK